MISIVLTTYNGEKNIIEQLDSIKNQQLAADEVLVFDDGSTDHTVEIVEDYIAKYSLCGWHLHKNKSNLGWRKNFINGMDQASGKYIFPCDQDDVWEKSKLFDMVSAMEKNDHIDLLASHFVEFSDGGGKTA